MTEFSHIEKISEMPGLQTEHCSFVYTTKASIMAAIHHRNKIASSAYKMVSEYLETGRITWEQAVLALNKHTHAPDILSLMGLKGVLWSR